jgi:tRNA-splicing ligase RtcB
VDEIFDPAAARAFGSGEGELLVTTHCGSRGPGHRIGTDYLQQLLPMAGRYGIRLPDRELACAPIRLPDGEDYLAGRHAGRDRLRPGEPPADRTG